MNHGPTTWNACVLAAAAACLLAPAGRAAEPARLRPDVRYPFLLVDRYTPGCRGTLQVNGATVLVFEGGEEGADVVAVPLQDGPNEIVLTLTRFSEPAQDEENPWFDLFLGRARGLDDDSFCFESIEAEDAASRLECRLEMADGRPVRSNRLERHWADPQRKRLVYEHTGEYAPGDEFYGKAAKREWDDDGGIIYEEEFAGPRLTQGRYYKPDGSVGAEVVDGNGWYRDWYASGMLGEETPYQDGLAEGRGRTWHESGSLHLMRIYAAGELHGPFRHYYENGKVRYDGQYAGGRHTGTWTVYAENGALLYRQTFRDGEWLVPPSRTIRRDRPAFSLTVPEGFEDYPGAAKDDPGSFCAFVSLDRETWDADLVITISDWGGPLGREPLPPRMIRRWLAEQYGYREGASGAAGAGRQQPKVVRADAQWRGTPLQGFSVALDTGDGPKCVREVLVPLGDMAIAVCVTGEEGARDRILEVSQALVASLEGDIRYGQPGTGSGPLPQVVRAAIAEAVILAAGLLVGVLVWVRRRRRQTARAGGPPPAPLPPP